MITVVSLNLAQRLADRLNARSNMLPTTTLRRREEPLCAAPVATTEPAILHDFETEQESTQEDRLRARHMRRVLNRPGRTNWLNIKDRLWLLRQSPRSKSPPIDRAAADDLAACLEAGVASGFPPLTLASSLWMRTIRQGSGRVLLDALENFSDADLRTVTVIYSGWSYTPDELERVTAAQVKAQFRQHLNRAGVTKLRGPLFAVLHGEYEPTSGRYILHYHLVTTVTKAAALKTGLTAKKIRGYTKTATGSAPVRRSRIGDRVGQLSYLMKAYWPCKPVIRIDGKLKRLRDHHRIPEPFGTQVLLWLDRQKFSDLVVTHDCWSRRKGGTAAMKRLYLFVKGVG